MTVWRWAPAAVAVAAALACGCETSGPSREDCTRMREHVAELAVGQAGATMSADDRKKHLANLGVASGEQYVDHCVKERSEKYVECALAAATLEELAKCGQRP